MSDILFMEPEIAGFLEDGLTIEDLMEFEDIIRIRLKKNLIRIREEKEVNLYDLINLLKFVYTGQGIREGIGILKSDCNDYYPYADEYLEILANNNLVEPKRWYRFDTVSTTRVGDFICSKLVKLCLEHIDIEEIWEKYGKFLLYYIYDNQIISLDESFRYYGSQNIDPYDIYDLNSKELRSIPNWSRDFFDQFMLLIEYLKERNLCFAYRNYVSTKGGELRQYKYFFPLEFLKSLNQYKKELNILFFKKFINEFKKKFSNDMLFFDYFKIYNEENYHYRGYSKELKTRIKDQINILEGKSAISLNQDFVETGNILSPPFKIINNVIYDNNTIEIRGDLIDSACTSIYELIENEFEEKVQITEETTSMEVLLVELKKSDVLHDRRLIRAFNNVPLEDFVGEVQENEDLYADSPKIFYYKDEYLRTISAPHMICIMLESLALEADDDLLILGAKSGYIAALASCLTLNGEIFIIEAHQEIVNITLDNLKRNNFDRRISVIHRNPLNGMKEGAPWQKILITGQIEKNSLKKILPQLDSNGGVLFAPIGTEEGPQEFTQIVRQNQDYYTNEMMSVGFGSLETELIYIDEQESELIPEEEIEITEVVDIEFKQDPSFIREKIEKIEKEYSLEEEPELSDAQIIQLTEKILTENKGFCNLMEIANKANIDLEGLVTKLQKENFGFIKKSNPLNYIDAILYVNEPEEESIEKIDSIAGEILDITESIKEEIEPNEIKHLLKQIKSEIENLKDLIEIPIKKIQNLLKDLLITVNNLTRANQFYMIKDGSYFNLINQFERNKMDYCENIINLIKKIRQE